MWEFNRKITSGRAPQGCEKGRFGNPPDSDERGGNFERHVAELRKATAMDR